MGDFLTDEEVKELIVRIKAGDNASWEHLCNMFERYIHKRGWKRLSNFDMMDVQRKEIEEDLYMAGWQGFISAIKNYDPEKGKFLTYATHYIDGEISKELDLQLNPLGLTERPKPAKSQDKSEKISRISMESAFDYVDTEVAKALRISEDKLYVDEAPDRGSYKADRRVLQIMEVLRILTDEDHSLSKEELKKMLSLYRIAKYNNGTPIEAPNTFNRALENMLLELNPMEYTEENDRDYKIKYEGYKENRLRNKLNEVSDKSSLDITGFSYVHIFDKAELDRIIHLISFTDMFSDEEKSRLIDRLVHTASAYYKTPFWDGEQIKFHPGAIHGRFSRRIHKDRRQFAENIKLIQQAINNLGQIQFKFNRYTAEHEVTPKTEYLHIISPYHLVVYHDNYYCIGLKKDDKRIWHYRVDLMSDIEILTDNDGKIIPIEVSGFEGLPIYNAYWDPEKYMAEHLNMAYDEPQNIRIKIRNTDYTIIHDWFGDHYEKSKEVCEDGYDIVVVKTSPSMIVHWAMQYSGAVEVMNEEIREKIKEELKKMEEKYGK